MLASAYQPYLYLSRPVSRRHPMDVGRRAKQFAPFAALRGLDETIRQQEIIYEPKRDLSEEKKKIKNLMINGELVIEWKKEKSIKDVVVENICYD